MLLPLSIVRWLSFSNAFRLPDGQPGQPPLAATVTVEVIYGLFGATNVILLLTTRRRLLLFEHPLTVLHERGLDSALALRHGSKTPCSSTHAASSHSAPSSPRLKLDHHHLEDLEEDAKFDDAPDSTGINNAPIKVTVSITTESV